MPHFVIYQGEAGLRGERDRLKIENDRLKRENDRLRALVGEPVAIAVAAEELQAQRLAPAAQQGGSGDVTFVIGAPAKAPVMNPLVARARGQRPAASQAPAVPVAPLVTDLPASTQEQEEDDKAPSQRFQLIEIK
jgi:hypothetical protein